MPTDKNCQCQEKGTYEDHVFSLLSPTLSLILWCYFIFSVWKPFSFLEKAEVKHELRCLPLSLASASIIFSKYCYSYLSRGTHDLNYLFLISFSILVYYYWVFILIHIQFLSMFVYSFNFIKIILPVSWELIMGTMIRISFLEPNRLSRSFYQVLGENFHRPWT